MYLFIIITKSKEVRSSILLLRMLPHNFANATQLSFRISHGAKWENMKNKPTNTGVTLFLRRLINTHGCVIVVVVANMATLS